MKTNLRGELTDRKTTDKTSVNNNAMVTGIADELQCTAVEEVGLISATITPILVNSFASVGDLTSLKQMEREGANLNAVDYMGRSPLHVICSTNGNMKIAKFLL